MRRQWFIIGAIFLLVPLLLAGCGIPQEQYDTLASDLSKTQQELLSVKVELGAAQTKVSELTSSLDKTKAALKAEQTKSSELASNLGKIENELEATKAENSEITSSLEKSRGELQATKSEYGSFKTEAKRLWTSLDSYLALNNDVLGINAKLLKDDLDGVYEGCVRVTARLAALGDSELQSLWESAYVVTGAEKWNLYYDPFYVFMAKHASRISSKVKVIRDKLAE